MLKTIKRLLGIRNGYEPYANAIWLKEREDNGYVRLSVYDFERVKR